MPRRFLKRAHHSLLRVDLGEVSSRTAVSSSPSRGAAFIMIFHFVNVGRKVGSHDPFPRTGAPGSAVTSSFWKSKNERLRDESDNRDANARTHSSPRRPMCRKNIIIRKNARNKYAIPIDGRNGPLANCGIREIVGCERRVTRPRAAAELGRENYVNA